MGSSSRNVSNGDLSARRHVYLVLDDVQNVLGDVGESHRTRAHWQPVSHFASNRLLQSLALFHPWTVQNAPFQLGGLEHTHRIVLVSNNVPPQQLRKATLEPFGFSPVVCVPIQNFLLL